MEYASYLAGEQWSDHPACTHPAVAALARLVNDCTSDSSRSELVSWIPSVVGIEGRGRVTSIVVAVHAASAALPVASEGRQRALAAGLLRCLELLEDETDATTRQALRAADHALGLTPGAARWAESFVAMTGPLTARSLDRMCDAVIRTAVVGIADACISEPDALLRELLVTVIETVRSEDAARTPVATREPELHPVG